MKRYRSVLIGVDLAEDDQLVTSTIAEPSREAIEKGIWLARENSARLTFFYVLPTWASNIALGEQSDPENRAGKRTIEDQANEVLTSLVAEAQNQGVAAEGRVGFGRSWIEIIRQVIRYHHDLVIVGARATNPIKQFVVGSTDIKLLRKCPCAVWVAKPQPNPKIGSILVAHDLSPVGDLAMELGCSMAQMHHSELHVVHAAEYPEQDCMLPARVSAESAANYRSKAEQHIRAQLDRFGIQGTARMHFEKGDAAFAIWDRIEANDIELVVMGTIARTGIPGLITGNTAERLLPLIPCSILAVKPAGFECPITLSPTSALGQ